jgi:hypothetical protein
MSDENRIIDALERVRSFVSGSLDAAAFEQLLYDDPAFERLFADDPDRPANSYVGRSLYQYMIGLDYSDPEDVLNAQGAMEEFLERKGIAVQSTDAYAKFYDLILTAQPRWLDVDARFVKERLMPEAGGRSGEELRHWLAQRLLQEFRFVTAPPHWIQNPEWPIENGRPLVFLGQLPVAGYFHDEAAVYVFHDQTTGECRSIIQVA